MGVASCSKFGEIRSFVLIVYLRVVADVVSCDVQAVVLAEPQPKRQAAASKGPEWFYKYDGRTKKAWRHPVDKPLEKIFADRIECPLADASQSPIACWDVDNMRWKVKQTTIARHNGGNVDRARPSRIRKPKAGAGDDARAGQKRKKPVTDVFVLWKGHHADGKKVKLAWRTDRMRLISLYHVPPFDKKWRQICSIQVDSYKLPIDDELRKTIDEACIKLMKDLTQQFVENDVPVVELYCKRSRCSKKGTHTFT